MGGGCEGVGVGVAAGDDDVTPDGAGDALGADVVDFTTGEVAAAEGTDAGTAVCRGCSELEAGRGLCELRGDTFVVPSADGAWSRPALGSLLALDGV